MSGLNQKLLIGVVITMLLSAFTYWRDANVGERFESGQKFLQGLDPDEIGTIKVTKGEETLTLERSEVYGNTTAGRDEFTLAEKDGYIVKNESVNRLVQELLDLELDKEVGSGGSLAEELGIEPPGSETVEALLQNKAGEPMVQVRVGNRADEGGGRYVQRLDLADQPIYLSAGAVSVDTSIDSYLRKEVANVEQGEVDRVEGPDFVLERPVIEGEVGEDGETTPPTKGELTLADAGSDTVSTGALNKVKGAFYRLQYDKVFRADAPEVTTLEWRRGLRVTREDKSGYAVMVAESGEDTFMRISAFLGVDRIELGEDEDDEGLKEKSEILKRNDEVQRFNSYHGSWVYQLTESTAEKMVMRRADLLE